MEYHESKKMGDVGENEILKRVIKQYSLSYIDNIGKANSDWDIRVPEKDILNTPYGIEVKMEYESKNTGNVVIEVMFDDRLSALSKTKASFWVFITGYQYIWIKPIEIYRFLEQHPEYQRARFMASGDTKFKIAYLPRLFRLLEYVRGLDKENGWVEEILKTDILYYDNHIEYLKKLKL